ncbi:MAG: VTT domain-containing protein [Patescibacteria group bacterium]
MNEVSQKISSFLHQRKISWKTDALWLAVIVLIILVFTYFDTIIPEPEVIESWTNQFGAWGPLVIIGIIIAETVFAPVPGTFIPIAIGALYGVWPGVLIGWVGNVIGSVIAFWIARKLGRPVVRRIISEEKLQKYDHYLHRRKMMIWVAYFIPLLPLDVISFVVGLSQIRFSFFFKIIAIGFAGNQLLLTLFGERLVGAAGWEKALWIALTVVFLAAAMLFERSSERQKK